MGNFSQKFRYHWRRYLAIGFLSLAIAFEVGYFVAGILSMWAYGSGGISSFSFIWNFVILMICYVMMLQGNVRNSYIAYRGVLSFTFLSTIVMVVDVLFNGASLLAYSSSPIGLVIALGTLLFTIGQIVLGIFCYIRLYGLMARGYTNFKALALFFSFFLGTLIISNLFTILYEFLLNDLLSSGNIYLILLILLSPISELFAAAGALVTIFRLRE